MYMRCGHAPALHVKEGGGWMISGFGPGANLSVPSSIWLILGDPL